MNSVSNGAPEIWRPVIGYEGYYEVSNLGRVRSLDRITQASNRRIRRKGKLLRPYADSHGYLQLRLWGPEGCQNAWVHRLVIEAFDRTGRPGEEVCHNNGDSLDNRAGNLRWDTRSSNIRDRALHGTQLRGEAKPCSKLNESQVQAIRRLSGVIPHSQIASRFGISRGYVSHIVCFRKWAHVPKAYAATELGVEIPE